MNFPSAKWPLSGLLVALFLFPAHAAYAQSAGTGAIRGTVANSATRNQLQGAAVRVVGKPLATFTEADGSFFFAAVPAGLNAGPVRARRPGPGRSGAGRSG
jgi:hypothetical protein